MSNKHKVTKQEVDTCEKINVEPQTLEVKETPSRVPDTSSFRRKAKAKVEDFLSQLRHSISRAPSRRRDEGEKSGVAKHPRHVYEDSGILGAEDRGISHNQWPDIGDPSEQEITHVSTQNVTSQFQGAHHVAICGHPHFENNRVKNEYYYCNHAGTYDIPILKEFVSFNVIHDSSAQDPTRRVYPGTRQYVLKRIRDWIDNPGVTEPIFWLHGPAGVGKSAIAQTIAHSCARGKLAATFFFYRSDASRNDGNRLFTTLAWQFAYSIPAIKDALIRSLIERPDICTKAVETQFEELIVKPFLELKRSGVQLSAPIVIIDGVDECSDDGLQQRFLEIIGNAVRDDRVPLRFLICSRLEAHIQDTIDIFRSITLPLDLAKLYEANHDIANYLRAEFSRIATEQDLDPAWPGEQIIQELVRKASGQFIYASTVIKYVGDKYSSAKTQLDIIRGLKPPSSISPFAELDELYKVILRRQRDPVFLKDFLSLLIGRDDMGYIGLPEDDAMLMNIPEKELHRKLRGMRSLLELEPLVYVHHRSFVDFLQDSSRSGQYHISKESGERQYLTFIVGSLVRCASTVIEWHDERASSFKICLIWSILLSSHKAHFGAMSYCLARDYPAAIVLPVAEWQEALQPLLDLQNKLLTMPNFRCVWEFLPCRECTGFYTMRHLLLHLAFRLGASGPIPNYALMAQSHADGYEAMYSGVTPSIPTEIEKNVLESDLGTCLSSLLPRLRRRKSGMLLGTYTIQLVCSLLRFDYAEIAMRLRSMLDAQNLMDVIVELIENKNFCSDYSPDISCKAVKLALGIHTRVPILPRSLLLNRTVGPRHDVWPTSQCSHEQDTELLFQTAFISKVLDPNYIVRVLWVYEEDKKLFSVVDKMNENTKSLSEWGERSKPSSVTRIRVASLAKSDLMLVHTYFPQMLEVAKAIRYFHSMGIVLQGGIDLGNIFLDSEFHARFRFLGVTTHYLNMIPKSLLDQCYSQEDNIFFFGYLFYEMYFDVQISFNDRVNKNRNAVAKRLSKPEICDVAWQLIQRCCATEPKSRPTMDDVVREMEAYNLV